MGFLDSIRDRFRGEADDDYYEDDYYDGYEGDQGYDEPAPATRRESRTSTPGSAPRLLGNTPRPEAESVSVYTRSGRPVGSSAAAPAPVAPYEPAAQTRSFQPVEPAYHPTSYEPALGGATSATPGDIGLTPVARVNSGQLPPYVLRPVSYDDVQTVVRRVKTNQPVVIVFRNTNIEVAKRILDFCFGLSYGLDGDITELGDRVFAVTPAGIQLSRADTPLFSIGACLGVVLAGPLGLPVALAAALGYAAVFGAATNTFLAPLLIGGEVFGWANLPAFFVVCAAAYLFNMGKTIYAGQLPG